ncbi:MAG: NAD(P)/FAD-dependent oxidoreductase, partial [archaeon]|nr:NAD(P)/FAD-dependent oxidoreductase [archaeon]
MTPVAIMEGGIVARNILEGNKIKPDYTAIPSVVFTIPPLASVGMQEEEAKNRGLNFKTPMLSPPSLFSYSLVIFNV